MCEEVFFFYSSFKFPLQVIKCFFILSINYVSSIESLFCISIIIVPWLNIGFKLQFCCPVLKNDKISDFWSRIFISFISTCSRIITQIQIFGLYVLQMYMYSSLLD